MKPLTDEDEPSEPQSGCLSNLGSLFLSLLVASSVLPLILFVASQLGRFVFVCELISNFQLFIFIALLPYPILLLLLRCWAWAVPITIATIWSGLLVLQVYWPAIQPDAGNDVVRIMSYNVFGHNKKYADTIKEITAADPDILVVCEYNRDWHDMLQVMHESFPHRITIPRWHGFGIAILSKIPIDSHEVLQLGYAVGKDGKRRIVTDNPCPVAKLKIGGKTVRIAGFHSLSPMTQERMSIRNQQFRELGNQLAKEDVPTLVIGDFNCTPWSHFLQKDLMERVGLRDSRQGIGYQGTWRADLKPLLIPIDHALVSRHIHVHRRWTGNAGGSDHLPIIVEVSVSPEEKQDKE